MVLFSTTHWFQLSCSSWSRILNLEVLSLPTFLLTLSKMCHIPPLKRKKGYRKFMKLFQHINYDWQTNCITDIFFVLMVSRTNNLDLYSYSLSFLIWKRVLIFFYKLIVIILSSKLFLSPPSSQYPPFLASLAILLTFFVSLPTWPIFGKLLGRMKLCRR